MRATWILVLALMSSSASATELWRKHIDAGNAAFTTGNMVVAEREFKVSQVLAEGDGATSAVALNLNNLALVRNQQGRYVDAANLFRRAAGIVEAQSGPTSPELARILDNEGSTLRKMGKHNLADAAFRRSIEILAALHGATSPPVANVLNDLGLNLASQARYEDSANTYRQALAINEERLGPDSRETAATLNNLALVLANGGRYAEGEPLLQRAFRIFRSIYGTDHPNVAACSNNLISFAREQGRGVAGSVRHPLAWIQPAAQHLMDGGAAVASFGVVAIAGSGPNCVAVIRFKEQDYVVKPGSTVPSASDPALEIRAISQNRVDAYDPVAKRLVRQSL